MILCCNHISYYVSVTPGVSGMEVPDWNSLPTELYLKIFQYMKETERFLATSACRRWRHCLSDPSFWRKVLINLEGDGEDRDNKLFEKNARRASEKEKEKGAVTSQSATTSQPLFSGRTKFILDHEILKKSCEVEISWNWNETESRSAVFTLMSHLQDNHKMSSLILNPHGHMELDHSRNCLIRSTKLILQNCPKLKQLSFGGEGKIIPSDILSILAKYCTEINKLNLCNVKFTEITQMLVSPNQMLNAVKLSKLETLSIDILYVSEPLLSALAGAKMENLRRMNLHVSQSMCDAHSVTVTDNNLTAEWERLTLALPRLRVSMIILKLCEVESCPLFHRKLLNQKIPLDTIKYIGCYVTDVFLFENVFSGLITTYAKTLETFVFQSNPSLGTCDKMRIFPMMMRHCTSLKHVTYMGGYVSLRYLITVLDSPHVANIETLVIEKDCIIVDTVASPYEIRISPRQVKKLENTIVHNTKIKEWRPLSRQEFYGEMLEHTNEYCLKQIQAL